jgi:hypothetical protein
VYRVNIAFERSVDVLPIGTRKRAYLGVQPCRRDGTDRLALALGCYCGSGLDYINAQFIQKPCDVKLVIRAQGDPWCLFAITQCGIEKSYLTR